MSSTKKPGNDFLCFFDNHLCERLSNKIQKKTLLFFKRLLGPMNA